MFSLSKKNLLKFRNRGVAGVKFFTIPQVAVGMVLNLLAHTILGAGSGLVSGSGSGSGPESGSGTGSGSVSGSGPVSVSMSGSVFESVFESVSESGLVLEPCNRLRDRKLFRKSVKSYKIRQWTNNLYNVFIV